MHLSSLLYRSRLSVSARRGISCASFYMPRALFMDTCYVYSEVVCLFRSLSLSLYTKSNAHWVSTSRPSLSLSLSYTHIHKKLWSVDPVSMAGKLMHAVQYFGYGGGASGLKVIFIFVVHFCNHHWILSSGFIHICKKFHDCWLLVFKFELLDLKKDCSLQIKIIVWGLNSRPISPLCVILCLCFQIILAHHVL